MSKINVYKVKKIYIILITVFLNAGLFSCTPEAVAEEEIEVQACCGDDAKPPPPPDN